MEIRKLFPSEYDEVYMLIKRTINEVLSKDYSPAIIDNMIAVDANRPRDTAHERDYFVAIQKSKIVGIIGVKANEIKTFFVDPQFRGKGIGTELLQFAEKQICNKGYGEVMVYSTVSGRTFYEKNGFTCIEKKVR